MKITSLVENTSRNGFPVEHGLSLYIQLDCGLRILFDMGQGTLFAENAERLGLSIPTVDLAIISHGHYDHGGGLRTFLEQNQQAPIYLHQRAFQPHYSLRDTGLRYIGLEQDLQTEGRIILCGALTPISPSLTLFAGVDGDCCTPVGNRLLYGPTETLHDDFCHEQSLLIREGDNLVLLAGCAHRGIINIMQRAQQVAGQMPTLVLSGMHLVKSGLEPEAEKQFISQLASRLLDVPNCQYYTMHCTGVEQYALLQSFMGFRINYLSCGDEIFLPSK